MGLEEPVRQQTSSKMLENVNQHLVRTYLITLRVFRVIEALKVEVEPRLRRCRVL